MCGRPHEKPPLAVRCCRVVNDFKTFTGDRRTNRQTDRQREDIAIAQSSCITSVDLITKRKNRPNGCELDVFVSCKRSMLLVTNIAREQPVKARRCNMTHFSRSFMLFQTEQDPQSYNWTPVACDLQRSLHLSISISRRHAGGTLWCRIPGTE